MKSAATRNTRFFAGTVLGVVAGIMMAGAFAVAAIPDTDDEEIHACVESKNGIVRVIDHEAGAQCRANESPLSWSSGPLCPAGTIPFTGVCMEAEERPTPLSINEASDDCADEGGRLPTSAELKAFSQQPGITFPNTEWSFDMGDHEGIFRFLVFSDPGSALAVAFDDVHYRCVLSPTS